MNAVFFQELQCSDWSIRPLTDEQMSYAVADAYYLLDIFAAFLYSLIKKGLSLSSKKKFSIFSNLNPFYDDKKQWCPIPLFQTLVLFRENRL